MPSDFPSFYLSLPPLLSRPFSCTFPRTLAGSSAIGNRQVEVDKVETDVLDDVTESSGLTKAAKHSCGITLDELTSAKSESSKHRVSTRTKRYGPPTHTLFHPHPLLLLRPLLIFRLPKLNGIVSTGLCLHWLPSGHPGAAFHAVLGTE